MNDSIIFKRCSVRSFTDMEVEENKIEKILKAAMQAPSAKNQQPWEFYVIRNKKILEELSKATPYSICTKNATIAIVPCFKTNAMEPQYCDIDMSACVENILLEAVALDLGAVWLGVSPDKERIDIVKNIIKCEDNLNPFCIIPIGYMKKEYTQPDRFDKTRIHTINKLDIEDN